MKGFERISVLAVAMSFIALTAFAQEPTDKTKLPEFEVASVRPSNPEQGFINAVTPSLKVDAGRNLTFVQVRLRDLIMLAYGVGGPQIQGPSFLNGTPEFAAD